MKLLDLPATMLATSEWLMGKKKDRDYLKLRDSHDTLDLGRLVAEQDSLLAQYYVAPEKYVARAINMADPATFFIGPKGIGKSAILQMIRLQKRSESQRIINITPDDLAFSALANTTQSPILGDAGRNQWLFKCLWDYVLSLEVLKREFQDQWSLADVFRRFFQGVHEKEAKRLVQLSSDSTKKTLTDRILQLIEEVEISGEANGMSVAGTATLREPSTRSLQESTHLLALVHSVAKTLPTIVKHPYYILIDDLDRYWSDTPIQNAFIAALFSSLKAFRRDDLLKSVVALRENIYKRLPLDDRDKYPDWVVHVKWDASSLQQMIEARLLSKLKINRDEIWTGLFPPKAFEQIRTHSNGRPREAIRLASLIIQVAAENGQIRVLQDHIVEAIRRFSDERIGEVSSEYQSKYPGLEKLVRRMRGWPREFSVERIVQLLATICLEDAVGEKASAEYGWVRNYEGAPYQFAEIFIECGFLWFKASRTDEARPLDPNDHFEITDKSWFAIHPMMASGLGIATV